MVSLLEAVLLGLVQGLTEWLPVSSSGHLVMVQEFLGIEVPLFFDILLHLGTITVIFVFFRRDIFQILKAFFRRDFKSDEGRLGVYIVVGNIPIAFFGYFFYDTLASFFTNLLVVGVALLVTGSLLFLSRYGGSTRRLSVSESLIVGVAQAVAVIPGISRSGFTIGTGLLRGVTREEAFRFSFLLAAPAVLGAALFDASNLAFYEVDAASMAVGFTVAMVVGYLSLRLLSRVVVTGRFHLFSYYCWAAGLLTLLAVMV
ncbi:MAG: undecaprenyl-diphosphate phosphatase [Nitrososphaerales archaeon]